MAGAGAGADRDWLRPPGCPVMEFTVDAALAGQRPDRALRAVAPGVERELAVKLLREGRILVNGHPATLRTLLAPGDKVRAKLDERRLRARPRVLRGSTPTPLGFGIVYMDDIMAIVDKPAGMPTHPGTGVADGDVLTHRVQQFLVQQGRPPAVPPAAAGRLDRGTSGLVVLRLAWEAEPGLGRAFQEGQAHKQYLALCQGVTAERFDVDLPLVVSRAGPGGGRPLKKLKEAHTRFERLAHSATASLLRVLPQTGRTHQIRRHLEKAGHPVVGDARYGLANPPAAAAEQLCLHMHHLELAHPVTGQVLDVEVDPPAGFQQAMEAAGLPPGAWRRPAALSARRAP